MMTSAIPMRVIMIALAALAIIPPATAEAQYKKIELKILGMDCAICAHGVKVAVQKVDGVESVQLSLEHAEADIRLKPENRVSLDQFRRIVKGNGFEPREAKVIVAGSVRNTGGRLTFEVPGTSAPLVIATSGSAPAVYKQLESSAAGGAPVEITGTVERLPDGQDSLKPVSVK
jgi:copper chaperone CopZ